MVRELVWQAARVGSDPMRRRAVFPQSARQSLSYSLGADGAHRERAVFWDFASNLQFHGLGTLEGLFSTK
jgi:hypothetical protein